MARGHLGEEKKGEKRSADAFVVEYWLNNKKKVQMHLGSNTDTE